MTLFLGFPNALLQKRFRSVPMAGRCHERSFFCPRVLSCVVTYSSDPRSFVRRNEFLAMNGENEARIHGSLDERKGNHALSERTRPPMWTESLRKSLRGRYREGWSEFCRKSRPPRDSRSSSMRFFFFFFTCHEQASVSKTVTCQYWPRLEK